MRGHAAADGQDALSGLHAGDVLGRGLQTDQNHLLAGSLPGLGILSGEDDLAAGGSGGSAQAAANGGGSLQRLGVELGMQQRVQVAGVDHQDGFRLGLVTLGHQIHGDLQGGGSGTLAVTGLQHVQLAVLHGELHILHIVVVVLQNPANLLELVECLGELVRHLRDGHGGTDTGHHVLALGVGQELAHQLLLAGGGVTGKGNAGAAVVTHVAESHGLHIDSGAPGIGNVVVPAVNIGAGVVPGTEHGLDGAHELLLGVGGEFGADLGLVLGLELVGQLLQILGGQIHVQLDALGFLHLVDERLEILLADFHNHIGVHLDKPAVAVVGPAGIAGFLSKNLHNILVQTQVQDGVHHAGHGGAGTGTDGDQQGVLLVTELLAGDGFQLFNIFHDLSLDLGIDLTAVLVVLGTCFRGNREALRNRQADVGHFRQVGTLAAQKLPHITVALGKQVNILVHWNYPFHSVRRSLLARFFAFFYMMIFTRI